MIMRLLKLSFVLLFMLIVTSFLLHYSVFRQVNTTILFDVVFFFLDVTGLCVVVSLFLALLRLSRSARSHQDSRQ